MERVGGKTVLCLLAMEGLRMEENVVLTGAHVPDMDFEY